MQKSILIAMRLTVYILLVCSLHLSAKGVSQNVTFTGRDVGLNQLFNVIKEQTGYAVFGNSSLLKRSYKVSITAVNMPLNDFLKAAFKGQPITYRVLDKTIVLYRKGDKDFFLPVDTIPVSNSGPASSEASAVLVKGRVSTADGKPLSGASITVKGTKNGETTDAQGMFEIFATPGKTLVITYVGMETKEVKVTESPKALDITLKTAEAAMKDVVVTGYSNVRKESFTGNAITVTKEEILKISNQNVIAVLQVFDPSLRIEVDNLRGSDPNKIPDFYIRGKSGIGVKELDKVDVSKAALTNNPNLPIFIMDGYEVTVQRVYDYDPNRIKTITILKDAAATAIYGSRAANGVIVIETLMPKGGGIHVNYNVNTKLAIPDISDYNLMNVEEKLRAEELSGLYDLDRLPYPYQAAQYLEDLTKKQNQIANGVNTDWIAQPLTNEVNQRHTLNIDGGNDNIRFGINLGMGFQNGVMKKSKRNTKSVGLILDYRKGSFSIQNNASYDGNTSANSPYGDFSTYTKKNPYDEIRGLDGLLVKNNYRWIESEAEDNINPLYEVFNTNNFNKSSNNTFSNNLSLNWRVHPKINIKGQFAITKTYDKMDDFTDPASGKYLDPRYGVDPNYVPDFGEFGELQTSNSEGTSINTNLFANYLNTIGGNNFNFSIGVNAVDNTSRGSAAYYRGFPSGTQNSPNFANRIIEKPNYNDRHTRLVGAFLAMNYSFKDIYLFDVSSRVDGSSEFGADTKFAPFWSFGAGVNVHKYNFLKNSNVFNLVKLTGSTGQLGKANFSPYSAKDIYFLRQGWYNTGVGVDLTNLGNPNLTWEKTNTYDVSLELGLLKNRVSLRVNWYNKVVNNALTDVNLPLSSGYENYKDNLGKIKNTGFDIFGRVEVLRSKNLMLAVTGNMSTNKNIIYEISKSLQKYNELVDKQFEGYNEFTGNQTKYSRSYVKYVEGGSLTSYFGMKSLGISPSDGKEIFVKRDGTITYDWEAAEQTMIGNSAPKVQGAFGLNMSYKKLSLVMTCMYKLGADLYNTTLISKVENANLARSNADRRALLDRWINPGDLTQIKNIKDSKLATRPTSRFIQRENEVKLNSLSLSYNLSSERLKKMGVSMLTIMANTNSLATFSTIRQERGLAYPFERTFDLTLSVGL